MRAKPILYVVAAGLAIAAFAVPLLLRQMPLPLRLLMGLGNLLAAFAVAMVIRQAREGTRLDSQMDRTERKQPPRP